MQRYGAGEGIVELPFAGGRLFQQYVCDAYAKIESERLRWVTQNQTKLRVESLQGLIDYLASANDTDTQGPQVDNGICEQQKTATPTAHFALKAANYTGSYTGVPCPKARRDIVQVGTPVILPATFGGSPRALHQSYLDALALVARFGRPDYFLTMTANPNWKEIQANLRPGETAANRPDLVARVFHAKLKKLLRCITKESFFGKAVAHTWVVEFQKRGLPHAHILLIVAEADKPKTAEDVDRFVSAEIPDPTTQPELYHLVDTHMVHGPCGHLNPACSCMKDGQCSKNYPKRPLRPATNINVNGYPEYARREHTPPRTLKRGVLGVGSVVPYCPKLLEMFECHLNVEICSSIKAIKYLYKYSYKGPDRACLEHSVNEVANFLDTRYCGAPEAAWRLFQFPLHGKSHVVERLPVHLPLQQSVLFNAGNEEEALMHGLGKPTKLEAWFQLNASIRAHDEETQQLITTLRYPELPRHFRWDSAG